MSTIDDLVDKYMGVLSIRGARPIVHVKTRIGSRWLGLCRWSEKLPHTTTITLDRSIVGDPRTLERILAHEMVHHRDLLNLTPPEIALIKMAIKPEGHGPSFRQGAAIINAVMGPDFVTVTSDQETVQSAPERDFYLLIAPAYGDTLGYAWAARLSPEALAIVEKKVKEGGKLLMSRDRRWTYGRAKIKRYVGLNIPKKGSAEELQLRALYERG